MVVSALNASNVACKVVSSLVVAEPTNENFVLSMTVGAVYKGTIVLDNVGVALV